MTRVKCKCSVEVFVFLGWGWGREGGVCVELICFCDALLLRRFQNYFLLQNKKNNVSVLCLSGTLF